jgi:alkylation response protein AidB-like acyl-CoA dehydrogenase
MSSDIGAEKGVGGIIHKVCRDFCRNEIEPVALELDSHYDLERIKAIWVKSSELELPSMLIPEEYGGVGQDSLTAAQVLEELAFGCAGVATLFAHHLAACIPLIEAGGAQEDIQRLIASSGEGEPVMATLAYPGLEEREDKPRLEKSKGAFSLSGVAPLVGCAALADYIILVLEEDGRISLVVVDTRSKGVSVEESQEMLGLHTLPFCDVAFDRCELGEADIIGEIGEATPVWEKTQATFNGFIAAMAMGTARSAYIKAYQYAQERYQFGKMIIEHHEIRRFLANMMAKLNMGTAGYTQALSGEVLEPPIPGRASDLAKIFCTDAALEIAIDAIQIHGGYGYMKETGLEKVMRDTKMLQLLGKSNRLMEVEVVEG